MINYLRSVKICKTRLFVKFFIVLGLVAGCSGSSSVGTHTAEDGTEFIVLGS